MKYLGVIIFTLISLFVLPRVSSSIPFSVVLDISTSSIPTYGFELELSLSNNNFITGDSYVLIDNVFISNADGIIAPPGIINFEDGTLQGFEDFLNPDSVNITPSGDASWWANNYVLRMDEDLLYITSITFQDFFISDVITLNFDFDFISSGPDGPLGPDNFSAAILDPFTLEPLIPGITPGYSDFIKATSNEIISTSDAVYYPISYPIPEPSSGLLLLSLLIGFAGITACNKIKCML